MWLKVHMVRLTNIGSVDDIRSSLKLAEPKATVPELQKELAAEIKFHNRKTVVNMIQAAINRKLKAREKKC